MLALARRVGHHAVDPDRREEERQQTGHSGDPASQAVRKKAEAGHALQRPSRAEGKGRVAAYEVLVPDKQMRQAIAGGKDFMDREQLPEGSIDLKDSIRGLLEDGEKHPPHGTVTSERHRRSVPRR